MKLSVFFCAHVFLHKLLSVRKNKIVGRLVSSYSITWETPRYISVSSSLHSHQSLFLCDARCCLHTDPLTTHDFILPPSVKTLLYSCGYDHTSLGSIYPYTSRASH